MNRRPIGRLRTTNGGGEQHVAWNVPRTIISILLHFEVELVNIDAISSCFLHDVEFEIFFVSAFSVSP